MLYTWGDAQRPEYGGTVHAGFYQSTVEVWNTSLSLNMPYYFNASISSEDLLAESQHIYSTRKKEMRKDM